MIKVDIPFHGLRLRCYPDSTVTSSALYFSGLADWWEMRFMQDYLRPGDSFLDIGANVGVYSLLAASLVGPPGRVDAFEPYAQSARRIEEQAAINRLTQIHVHRFAVSDRNGELDFGLSNNDATLHLRRNDESGGEHAQPCTCGEMTNPAANTHSLCPAFASTIGHGQGA